MVNTFLTLDGVMQAPGQPDEDRDGGFDQGGWQVPFFDEKSGEVMSRHMADFDALLVGRRTYELFAAYRPQAPADDPIAARLNSAPTFVASRTLDTGLPGAGWTNSTVLKGISQTRSRRREQRPVIARLMQSDEDSVRRPQRAHRLPIGSTALGPRVPGPFRGASLGAACAAVTDRAAAQGPLRPPTNASPCRSRSSSPSIRASRGK